MQYIVDIIFLIIFGLTIFDSARRGFFLSLFDFLASLVSFIAAKICATTLATTVFDSYFRQAIETNLSKNLGDVGSTDYSAQIESFLNSIPESLNGVMQMIGIDKQGLIDKVSSSDMSGKTLIENIMDSIATPVGTAVVQAILFVIFTMVFIVVLRIIIKLLDKIIKKLPAIKQVNTGLGAVFGILRGVLTVFILVMILGIITSLINSAKLSEAVNNSLIVEGVQKILSMVGNTATA